MNEQTQADPTLKPLADDAVADAVLIGHAIKAYKSGGKAALLDLLPEATALARKEYTDVKAAIPSIKSGYKTSEFWLSLGVPILIGVLALKGITLPVEATAAIGAVITTYTVIRGLVKKPAA